MSDPKRLLDGDGELSRLLRAAERDVIDDEAVERLRARVAAAGAVTAGATLATGKSTSAAMTALGSKLAALALATTMTGAAYLALHRSNDAEPASVSAPASVSVSASASVSASVSVSVSAPVSASVSVSASASDPVPLNPPPRPVSRPKVVATVEPAPAATSPREGLLLLQARQALSSDPARALALVRQHESEFPASQLGPERDKLRSEAAAKVQKESSP